VKNIGSNTTKKESDISHLMGTTRCAASSLDEGHTFQLNLTPSRSSLSSINSKAVAIFAHSRAPQAARAPLTISNQLLLKFLRQLIDVGTAMDRIVLRIQACQRDQLLIRM
jgi:hypothetical protein